MVWLIVILSITIGPWVLFALIGLVTPRERATTRSVFIPGVRPEKIWKTISNFATSAAWRDEIKKIEAMPARDGQPVWREYLHHGPAIPLATIVREKPHRLVREVADERLPYTGSFEYELLEEDGGTRVRFTERSGARNIIKRGMQRIITNHGESTGLVLTSIAKRFGADDAEIEKG